MGHDLPRFNWLPPAAAWSTGRRGRWEQGLGEAVALWSRHGALDEDRKWWNQYILKMKTTGLPGGLDVGAKENRVTAESQDAARALRGR